MVLTILAHINIVRLLFIIGIALMVLPIFLYNTVLAKEPRFKTPIGWCIFAGVVICIPMLCYFYYDIRYDAGSFSLEDKLYLAAENKNLKAAKAFLKQGGDPCGSNRYDRSAAVRAVMLDDTEMTELFLENGADPNTTDGSTKTLLSIACENGCTENVRQLLAAGADPDYGSGQFVPALHYAAMNDTDYNDELIQLLILAGADPGSSAYMDGKEMLPFRYYFDTHEKDKDITDEEEARYQRIKDMLYEPYIRWLSAKMEKRAAEYNEEAVS